MFVVVDIFSRAMDISVNYLRPCCAFSGTRLELEKNTPPPVVAVVTNTELCMCALHNMHIECKINQKNRRMCENLH